ncbi:MAG: helix-turn-helix domain-containing protein [Oscillospiraceae bacterium]|nr:helix-turn-helix domain-containing protein [Oscillospiraceae bacterium]
MLGDRIKELRNKKCIYQQALANALNVSKSTVAMWETNKREPDLEMIKRIAEYFSVSTDYLVNWEKKDKKPKFSFEYDPWEFLDSALADHFPQYSKKRIEKVVFILESLDRFNDAGLQAVEHHINELSQIMEYLTEEEIERREEEYETTLLDREEEQKLYQEYLNQSNKK